MLPPFIIEQIRKREQEKVADQPARLELPLERPMPRRPTTEPPSVEDKQRGVVIVEL
jgi:hypothetical protein